MQLWSMQRLSFHFSLWGASLALLAGGTMVESTHTGRAPDPCAAIGGQKWVPPKAVRDCFTSIKTNETLKTNIIEVISKTLAFHTSVNYQIRAPQPFTQDVHEDVYADLARIRKQRYHSDYDLHIDFSRTLKRLNDGHCVWINNCYDGTYSVYLSTSRVTSQLRSPALFVNYLPTPLVLLTDSSGKQGVHIAPEAFTVASTEFPDQIDFWQNALPGKLKGQLASLSGAKVILINGLPPNFAVDFNAGITGGFQGRGTRQNAFFSSYRAGASWTYLMGSFAAQALPLDDEVTLTIQRTGTHVVETIKLPYRSRFMGTTPFVDTASLLANNCQPVPGTNGIDIYASAFASVSPEESPLIKFQQQPPISPDEARKHSIDVILDTSPLSNVVLPPELTPQGPVPGSSNAAQFYMLDDGKTGVLALGSFSDNDFYGFLGTFLQGLLNLRSAGATQLVVDVTNNGGGFVCAAAVGPASSILELTCSFRRIPIVAPSHRPKASTDPQAGLNTTARAGPLAQQIVKEIVNNNRDPRGFLLYTPQHWRDANHNFFPTGTNWLQPPVHKVINGRHDFFSQQLGQECQPEGQPTTPPSEPLFDTKKVVIVSNGRCASSCALFSVTMSKLEGSKTVVVGGRKGVQQQYCGTVGGQSLDFSRMDTEIKTTQLKNNPLAPPDLLVNGILGITWRLGYGIDDPSQPEEWQDHSANLNLPLTPELVNNPLAIWKEVVARLL